MPKDQPKPPASDLPKQRPFLNLDEAAAFVGLKPPTLRRAIRQGKLAYAKPGRAYLVRPADVTGWLESELRLGGVKLNTNHKRGKHHEL